MVNDRYYFKTLAERFLNDETTEQENEELSDWLKDNSELRMMIANDLEASSNKMPESVKRRVYKRIVNGNQSGRKTKTSKWFNVTRMLAAACLMLTLSIGVLLYRQVINAVPQVKPLEVKTEATNRSKLQLPDGTSVCMNTMSTLSYNLDVKNKQRIVHLDGEGYFEVAADKSHPFKIITNGMEVLCLGTKFDIKSYKEDNSAKVILKEGSVKVTSGTQEILMTPGTCVTYDKATGNLSQSKVQKDSAREWISGYSYYHNENLENIVNELSRSYGKRFVITSPEIGNETFSGYLGKGTLDEVLDALSMASGISYKHVNDSTVLIFNNKK
jgi:transmembrane sensor